MKRKHMNLAPLGAAFAYLTGLFMLVMDRYLVGALMIIIGVAAGAYSGIKALRSAYRPSRAPDPMWKRLVSVFSGETRRNR